MTELPCPICSQPLRDITSIPWRIKMLESWSDGAVPFAIRKRGTDYAGTCDYCRKRLLVEAHGPRYAEIGAAEPVAAIARTA